MPADAVGISIRDTGQGMPRETLKRIFTPFFTTKERGVGLGLALCRRIIRNHGGRIRGKIDPRPGDHLFHPSGYGSVEAMGDLTERTDPGDSTARRGDSTPLHTGRERTAPG